MGKLERGVAQKNALVETANGIVSDNVFQDHGPLHRWYMLDQKTDDFSKLVGSKSLNQ